MNYFAGKMTSMRWQLIVTLGAILLICQVVSVLWLWHESKEQIDFLVNKTLTEQSRHQHIEKEIHEAIAALSVPSVVIVVAAMLLSMHAVNRITRPLSRLEQELRSRTAENLEPLSELGQAKEITAVTHSVNQLFSRLSETLNRDRQFTSDVAHELRTPLSGIRLHLELYEQRHQIDCKPLIKRIDNMVRTVDQLLQLARVGLAFSSGSYQTVSMRHDVMGSIREEVEDMVHQRNQRIDWGLPDDDPRIKGDATLLRLLLRNLIENAHRYSPEGSVISVRLKSHPDVELQVSDQGPGIDESKVGELSQAFVRMDSRYGGIGLGLSIVTRITQLHQGRFFLGNRRDADGTCARIVFASPT